MNIGYAISYFWDVLARPQCIGAVLTIVFLQYRSVILNWFYTAINDGIMQTFFSLILNLGDEIRGYYHTSHELVRGLGQNYVFSFADENYGVDYDRFPSHPSLQREPGDSLDLETTNVPDHNNIHKLNSSSGKLPKLAEVRNSVIFTKEEMLAPNSAASNTTVTTDSKLNILENEMVPLEPAFLNKQDYPQGWLVFHPVLGISSVQEADQYEEEQSVKSNKHKKLETKPATSPSYETRP